MYTEEEAKTKWCPVNITMRVYPSSSGATICQEQKCIASSCMMWRETGQSVGIEQTTGKVVQIDLTGNVIWYKTGFCGLGGKP